MYKPRFEPGLHELEAIILQLSYTVVFFVFLISFTHCQKIKQNNIFFQKSKLKNMFSEIWRQNAVNTKITPIKNFAIFSFRSWKFYNHVLPSYLWLSQLGANKSAGFGKNIERAGGGGDKVSNASTSRATPSPPTKPLCDCFVINVWLPRDRFPLQWSNYRPDEP